MVAWAQSELDYKYTDGSYGQLSVHEMQMLMLGHSVRHRNADEQTEERYGHRRRKYSRPAETVDEAMESFKEKKERKLN